MSHEVMELCRPAIPAGSIVKFPKRGKTGCWQGGSIVAGLSKSGVAIFAPRPRVRSTDGPTSSLLSFEIVITETPDSESPATIPECVAYSGWGAISGRQQGEAPAVPLLKGGVWHKRLSRSFAPLL